MSKSKLLSALGRSEEARGQASARSLSKRISSAAGSVAGDSETKKAALKGRILRNVKREVDAARKKNPDISQEDLRKVAARALGSELKAIKEGKSERNLRKEAAQKRKGEGQKDAPKTPGTVTPLGDEKPLTTKTGQGLLFSTAEYVAPSREQMKTAAAAAVNIKRKIDQLKSEIEEESSSNFPDKKLIARNQEKLRNLGAMMKKQALIAKGEAAPDFAYRGTEVTPHSKKVGKITDERVNRQVAKLDKTLKGVEQQKERKLDKKLQAAWDAKEGEREARRHADNARMEKERLEQKKKEREEAEAQAKAQAEIERSRKEYQQRKDNYPAYSQALDDAVKQMRGKKQTIDLTVYTKPSPDEKPVESRKPVEATVYGDVAVHKGTSGGWVVSHVPSGTAIHGSRFKNQNEAKRLAAALILSGADLSTEKVSKDSFSKAAKALEAVTQNVAPKDFNPSNPPKLNTPPKTPAKKTNQPTADAPAKAVTAEVAPPKQPRMRSRAERNADFEAVKEGLKSASRNAGEAAAGSTIMTAEALGQPLSRGTQKRMKQTAADAAESRTTSTPANALPPAKRTGRRTKAERDADYEATREKIKDAAVNVLGAASAQAKAYQAAQELTQMQIDATEGKGTGKPRVKAAVSGRRLKGKRQPKK